MMPGAWMHRGRTPHPRPVAVSQRGGSPVLPSSPLPRYSPASAFAVSGVGLGIGLGNNHCTQSAAPGRAATRRRGSRSPRLRGGAEDPRHAGSGTERTAGHDSRESTPRRRQKRKGISDIRITRPCTTTHARKSQASNSQTHVELKNRRSRSEHFHRTMFACRQRSALAGDGPDAHGARASTIRKGSERRQRRPRHPLAGDSSGGGMGSGGE